MPNKTKELPDPAVESHADETYGKNPTLGVKKPLPGGVH